MSRRQGPVLPRLMGEAYKGTDWGMDSTALERPRQRTKDLQHPNCCPRERSLGERTGTKQRLESNRRVKSLKEQARSPLQARGPFTMKRSVHFCNRTFVLHTNRHSGTSGLATRDASSERSSAMVRREGHLLYIIGGIV